ncbi:MAG: mechanosensitive ion channel [candidate division Zixibacteria bacterium]|nr:mechanosensitive ion channel [candidate division Zixibacteria bacterium]
MENYTQILTEFATVYGLKVIGAIIILIIGRFIAGIGRRTTRKLLNKANTDEAIVSFVGSLVYTLVIVFTVLAALSKFGVETASIIAVLGAAGFAVGFALQGSLANFAAGVLILVFRSYRIGDYVTIAGVGGTVKEIKIFNTILSTPDNVHITVPNGKIFGDVITNYSQNDERRVDFVVGIGYGSSIPKAIEVLEQIIKGESRILANPAYQIAVSELADSSVNFVVRPWVKKEDYWGVKFDLTRKIKEEFDKNDIEIPFPQTTVHMAQTS